MCVVSSFIEVWPGCDQLLLVYLKNPDILIYHSKVQRLLLITSMSYTGDWSTVYHHSASANEI